MTITSTSAVETSLIRHLENEKQYGVLDLLRTMGDEGFSDSDIKGTIALMLHEQRIELTPDRRLRSTAVPA